MTTYSVILCSAGNSTRFGAGVKKEYLPLRLFLPADSDLPEAAVPDTVSVLSACVSKFLTFTAIKNIVIVIPQGQAETAKKLLQADAGISVPVFPNDSQTGFAELKTGAAIFLVSGGKTRQASVFEGLKFLQSLADSRKTEYVFIHDAARPFFSPELINRMFEKLAVADAVIPGVPSVDTQKRIGEDSCVTEHLVRSGIRAVQTPQAFKTEEIYTAHRKAISEKQYTDDSEVFFDTFPEKKILVIEGELSNKKITYSSDAPNMNVLSKNRAEPNVRIGFGYDIHRLAAGKPCILGGVQIKSEKGFIAHSDGDVLLHAITDALLGAAGFSDIGELFPPSDPTWKNADSGELLKKAWALCNQDGRYRIQNLDCVLVMEAPKLLPYRDAIRRSIAALLNIEKEQVFVKAKTAEKTGAVGKGKAVEVFATVLVTERHLS